MSQRWRKPSASGAFSAVLGRRREGAGGRATFSADLVAGVARVMPMAAKARARRMRFCPDGSEWETISGRLDQPAVPVAGRIELREGCETAADGGERQRFLRVRNKLWHDAPCAVGELIDAPELFGPAGERRQRHQLGALSRREHAVSASDGDFEIR